jgi:hypothetical protein
LDVRFDAKDESAARAELPVVADLGAAKETIPIVLDDRQSSANPARASCRTRACADF